MCVNANVYMELLTVLSQIYIKFFHVFLCEKGWCMHGNLGMSICMQVYIGTFTCMYVYNLGNI